MKYIDYYINKAPMYRLVSIGLLAIAVVAIVFGFTGTLTLSGASLLTSLLVIMLSGIIADQLFSRIYGFASNEGSSMITALIVFFLFFPANNSKDYVVLALGTFVAIASKYIVAIKQRHIFNPAAFAAVVLGVSGFTSATWWVGSTVLALFVLILGLLILRKLHRFSLFGSFLVTAVVIGFIKDIDSAQNVSQLANDILISSPLLFLGMIMLTEPSTLPASRKLQVGYGALVGALYALPLPHVTPEIALLIGNVVAFSVSKPLRYRSKLQLIGKKSLSPTITEYEFTAERSLTFNAGQYVDISLPIMAMDFRGNRRTFTIASSPTETTLRFAMRNSSSKFKSILSKAPRKSRVYIDGAQGEFILPEDTSKEIVWIAGGIGVTPFRSMARYIIDTNQNRNIVFFYVAAHKHDFIYIDIFAEAAKNGITTKYVADRAIYGADGMRTHVPDYQNKLFYISGPDAMVRHYKSVLVSLNVSQKNIITDYFSGY